MARGELRLPEGGQFSTGCKRSSSNRCDQFREQAPRAFAYPILPICTHEPVPEQVLAALGRTERTKVGRIANPSAFVTEDVATGGADGLAIRPTSSGEEAYHEHRSCQSGESAQDHPPAARAVVAAGTRLVVAVRSCCAWPPSVVAFRAWRTWRANAYRRAALRELAAATSVAVIAEILKRTRPGCVSSNGGRFAYRFRLVGVAGRDRRPAGSHGRHRKR